MKNLISSSDFLSHKVLSIYYPGDNLCGLRPQCKIHFFLVSFFFFSREVLRVTTKLSGKYRGLLCRHRSYRCTAASTINIPHRGGPLVTSHRLTLTHYHPESIVHSRVYSDDAHSEFRQMFNDMCLPSEYYRVVSLPCKPPLSLTFYYDSFLKKIIYFFNHLAMPYGIWDLSSSTRDQTQSPALEG